MGKLIDAIVEWLVTGWRWTVLHFIAVIGQVIACIIVMWLFASMAGCKSIERVVTLRDTVSIRDTVNIVHTQKDIVMVRDTARITIREAGETIFVNTERLMWRDKIVTVHDTVERVGIERTAKKEEVQVKKKISTKTFFYVLAMLLAVFACIRIAVKK